MFGVRTLEAERGIGSWEFAIYIYSNNNTEGTNNHPIVTHKANS